MRGFVLPPQGIALAAEFQVGFGELGQRLLIVNWLTRCCRALGRLFWRVPKPQGCFKQALGNTLCSGESRFERAALSFTGFKQLLYDTLDGVDGFFEVNGLRAVVSHTRCGVIRAALILSDQRDYLYLRGGKVWPAVFSRPELFYVFQVFLVETVAFLL